MNSEELSNKYPNVMCILFIYQKYWIRYNICKSNYQAKIKWFQFRTLKAFEANHAFSLWSVPHLWFITGMLSFKCCVFYQLDSWRSISMFYFRCSIKLTASSPPIRSPFHTPSFHPGWTPRPIVFPIYPLTGPQQKAGPSGETSEKYGWTLFPTYVCNCN